MCEKLARGVHMYEDGTGRPGDRPRRMLLGMFFDVTNPKKVDNVGTQRGTVADCQPPGEAGSDWKAWERPVGEQVLRSR